MNHVSAFKYLHQEKDITTDSSQHSNHVNNSQLNKYKGAFTYDVSNRGGYRNADKGGEGV